MNISEVKKCLPALMRNGITPYLHGSQGVGKTEVVGQIASLMGYRVMHLHLSTQETGDLVGLLVENGDGTVSHARPCWFPTEGKWIIFLDEFNRAMPEVLQVMLPFTLSKTIHTHKLPDDCYIVAAGNYQSNQFNVTDMSDAALISRFCHIDFVPTKEEFVTYCDDQNASDIADFIRAYPEMLEVNPKDRFDFRKVEPDRRSWKGMIHKLEKESSVEDCRFELYQGIVGSTAAAAFMTFKAKKLDRLSGRDILDHYDSVRARVMEMSDAKESRFDLLSSAVDEMFLIMDQKEPTILQATNFKEFLLDIPLELGLKVINRLEKSSLKFKNEILNEPEYAGIFENRKLNRQRNAKVKAKK